MHVHAFSPLEIWQGAQDARAAPFPISSRELNEAGLGTLPGTAAEILDDEVRAMICPDKVTTAQWLEVMGAAHGVGLRTTATIMFGHVDRPEHWARHLLRIRALQATHRRLHRIRAAAVRADGSADLSQGPRAARPDLPRGGADARGGAAGAASADPQHPDLLGEDGPAGVAACLEAGANDLGGTLMNESITRAAGAEHGQEMPPEAMEALIRSLGRTPRQRTTLYADAPTEPPRRLLRRSAAVRADQHPRPPLRTARAARRRRGLSPP